MVKSNNYGTMFKQSATVSAGVFFGMIPQLLIGAVILGLGVYLMQLDDKNKKEQKEDTHGWLFYLGIILVVLGSVFCLQIGFGIDFLSDQFNN